MDLQCVFLKHYFTQVIIHSCQPPSSYQHSTLSSHCSKDCRSMSTHILWDSAYRCCFPLSSAATDVFTPCVRTQGLLAIRKRPQRCASKRYTLQLTLSHSFEPIAVLYDVPPLWQSVNYGSEDLVIHTSFRFVMLHLLLHINYLPPCAAFQHVQNSTAVK